MGGGSKWKAAKTLAAVRRASRLTADATIFSDASADRGASSGLVSSFEGNHKPRLVFGSVPSQDEAKEATLDITTAMERMHSSSTLRGNNVRQGSTTLPLIRQAGLQALLLMRRPEVQRVVTSIASNRRVWQAMMDDEAMKEFFNNHISVTRSLPSGTYWERMDTPMHESSGFISWLSKVIESLVEMLSMTSSFLESIYGILCEGFGLRSDDCGTSNATLTNMPISLSILLLAITTMLVVLLKRRVILVAN